MKAILQKSKQRGLLYNPGLILISGDYIDSDVDNNLKHLINSIPDANVKRFNIDNWVKGCLITKSNKQFFYTIKDEVVVLVDGYLTDIINFQENIDFLENPAEAIAVLYKKFGTEFLKSLRGSYSFLIMDLRYNKINIVTDRRGSRPIYYSVLNKYSMFIAPDINILSNLDRKNQLISFPSVCEFISSGRFYKRRTLFKNIKNFGQANILSIDKTDAKIEKYWSLKFKEENFIINESEIIEEFDSIVQKAVSRVLKATKNYFLFLSGGIDSRIILSYILAENTKIPVVSFGINSGPDDDCEISEKIAENNGLELIKFRIQIEDFHKSAEQVVKWTGSVVEVIDCPSLLEMWVDLNLQFDTFLNGDECFGWKPHVNSFEKALNSNVIYRMKQASRLVKWIKTKYRKNIIESVDNDFDSLIRENRLSDPDITKDSLYYKERLHNEVNAFTYPKLKFFEQARPLIDEDIIDFISDLPARFRTNKALYQNLLKKKFPEMLSPGFAKKSSLPTPKNYKHIFKHSTAVGSFVKVQLLDQLNNDLAAILDMNCFKKDVTAILEGSNLTPLSNFWGQLPGFWRFKYFQPENHADPVTLMLRILQLSLYLNTFKRSNSQ